MSLVGSRAGLNLGWPPADVAGPWRRWARETVWRCGRVRHTNLLEQAFGETRRRTKVIGRLPGERSCLSLVWAVLDRASRGWRGGHDPGRRAVAAGTTPPAPLSVTAWGGARPDRHARRV